MLPEINWLYLTDALARYQDMGFERVELPWIIRTDVSRMLCADDDRIFHMEYEPRWSANPSKSLVGSAEQAFLQHSLDGLLPAGRYCSLTPCFRNEPEDETHQKQFMKVELFSTLDDVIGECGYITKSAQKVMSAIAQGAGSKEYVILPTPNPVTHEERTDIMFNDIEVGSYGIRSYKNVCWAFGTGLAEPRFSQQVKALIDKAS